MLALLTGAQFKVEEVGERLVALLRVLWDLGLGCGGVTLSGRPRISQAGGVIFLLVLAGWDASTWRCSLPCAAALRQW